MKAAVLYGKENVRVTRVNPPRLKRGEVRVRVEAALTCGTDLKVFKRGYHEKMIVPPAVFGHELAGTIEEVAAGVARKWKRGDRVVVANSAPCGKCDYCRRGQENLCDDLLFLNGAYAEFINVPARIVATNMLTLKAATSFADAALTEPLACVVQGVEDAGLKKGDEVLVIGAGPIGLMFVALAKNIGCRVTVAGRGNERINAARRLGAWQVLDVSREDWLVQVMNKRDDGGFDVVIEAVGKPETWAAAVQLVRKGGTVNFFGGCPAGSVVELDTSRIHYSSLTLRASFHHTPRTIRRALALIEKGVIRARDFVDGECALDDLPALFRQMAEGNRAVKTLVRPQQSAISAAGTPGR